MTDKSGFEFIFRQMSIINRLIVKAAQADSLEQLSFIMANDFYQLVNFDRAVAMVIENGKARVLNVSGQTSIKAEGEKLSELVESVSSLSNPLQSRFLSEEAVSVWQKENPSKIYWLAFPVEPHAIAGIWIEKWDLSPQSLQELPVSEKMIQEFLIPGLKLSFNRLYRPLSIERVLSWINKRRIITASLALLLALFLIRVPLRVIAPCEVVALDPYVITAPLDGVIQEILVEPGQEVQKSALLVQYDPRILAQQYKIAEKEKGIIQSQIDAEYTQSLYGTKEGFDLAVLKARFQKSEADLNFIKSQIDLQTIKAPFQGIIEVSAPDEWRGRPVKIGEKIMTISDPHRTKVKIWISERDNVNGLFQNSDVLVILNTLPGESFTATLTFISPMVRVEEHQVPSFLAEAQWKNPNEANPQLGLKGTAILYGESVSLFYYFFRKPLLTVRKFLGV